MHTLLFYYLFQTALFNTPAPPKRTLHYAVQYFPGLQEHTLTLAQPTWSIEYQHSQVLPYAQSRLRLKTQARWNKSEWAVQLGMEHAVLKGIQLPNWQPYVGSSLSLRPHDQLLTYLHLSTSSAPSLRQYYFIDPNWTLSAGWRPLPSDLSPLFFGLSHHRPSIDVHLLQQGRSTALGLTYRQQPLAIRISLVTYPMLLPTTTDVLWNAQ